jgi:hypothetical protein
MIIEEGQNKEFSEKMLLYRLSHPTILELSFPHEQTFFLRIY